MQRDIILKNRIFDRGLLLIVALICAVSSWAFFNLTGEYAFILFLAIWFLSSINDAKKVRDLQAENEQLKQQIKDNR